MFYCSANHRPNGFKMSVFVSYCIGNRITPDIERKYHDTVTRLTALVEADHSHINVVTTFGSKVNWSRSYDFEKLLTSDLRMWRYSRTTLLFL